MIKGGTSDISYVEIMEQIHTGLHIFLKINGHYTRYFVF
jgi:hypothetical protein